MSFLDKKEIKCTCGKNFNTKVFLSVNLVQTPELKEIILEGRFNVVKCPNCERFLYVEVPFFYLDANEGMVIYVYPKSYEDEKERYIREAETNFELSLRTIEDICEEHKDYFLKIFFGIENLVEFLTFQEKEKDEKEFLNEVANTMNLKIIDLPIDKSRQKNIVSKLPYVDRGNKITLENIIEGLTVLVEKYPQLNVYKKLLDDIKLNDIVRENLIELLEKLEI